MSWVKGDGAKIKITFTEALVGALNDLQDYFSIIVPEYTHVPGGAIQNVTKNVASTYSFLGIQSVVDLSSGTLNDTTVQNGVLSLEVNV